MRVRRGVVVVVAVALAVLAAYVVTRPHRADPRPESSHPPGRVTVLPPPTKQPRPARLSAVAAAGGRLGVLWRPGSCWRCPASLVFRTDGATTGVRVPGRTFGLRVVTDGWLLTGFRLRTSWVSLNGTATRLGLNRSPMRPAAGDVAVGALDGDCWVWHPAAHALHPAMALPGGRPTVACWIGPDGTLVAATAPLNGQPHAPGLWTNAGGAWHETPLPRALWSPESLVGNGRHVVAMYLGDDVSIRRLEISDDSGVTWRGVGGLDVGYDSVAVSSDGSVLVAGDAPVRLAPGAATAHDVGERLQSVVSDGRRFYALTFTDDPQLRSSTDGGRTWQPVRPPGPG